MTSTPDRNGTELPEEYAEWLAELKTRIHGAQQRAALAVNRELDGLYWRIGREILDRQTAQGLGAKVVIQLSSDLRSAFPEMKGFSRANLMYMRSFAQAWDETAIVQQPVGQLPWGHHLVLLTKLKEAEVRFAYADAARTHGWSRTVLVHQIEARTLERSGKAVSHFETALPAADSDLAREVLKDPYKLDFLGLGEDARERDIENALVEHVTDFLLRSNRSSVSSSSGVQTQRSAPTPMSRCASRGTGDAVRQMTPRASMASATWVKPAMLAPAA